MDFLPYDQDKDLNASGLKDGFREKFIRKGVGYKPLFS